MKYVLLLALACTGCAKFAEAWNAPMPQQSGAERDVQTDMTCMNRCTSSGYMLAFCQSKCSY